MLISILSTSLVLQTFFFIPILCVFEFLKLFVSFLMKFSGTIGLYLKKKRVELIMDTFTDSATQAILAQLLVQVNSLTNEFQNARFEAINVEVYRTLCRYCNGTHMSIECQMVNPMGELKIEQAQYLAKFPPLQNLNPFAQNFNPGWKNHPNLSWRNQKCHESHGANETFHISRKKF